VKFLLLLLTAVLGTTNLLPAASALKEIYVAVRTDGLSGSGTMSDPFNGSTEARFDAVMKGIGPNTQINLSAGTFLTHGASAYSLQAGWKIQGSGMGVTIVKLVGFVSNTQKYIHFGSWNLTDNVEIHDLTCDANYEGWKWPAHDAVGGIDIWGNNVLVENVEMINCYGDSVEGIEQFSILLGGNQGGNHQIASNCTIEGCKTHQYAPGSNYTNGAGISYCINPRIINCTDDGGNHGFGFAGTSNTLISGCTTTSKTARGYYTDTSATTGLVIQGNSFSASEIPIQFNSAGLAQNVRILNNTLTSYSSEKPGNAAIVLCGAKGSNFTITGNKYIYLGSLASGLVLNNGAVFTGLDVENNSSNAGLVGWGGNGSDVDNASNHVANNKFNLPLSSLTGGNASSGSVVNTQIVAATTTGADSAPASVSSPSLPVGVQQNGTTTVAANGTGASMFIAPPSPLNVWLPPSSGISAQDKGVRSHTNLRVLDVPDTDSAALAQFNTPAMLRAVYQLPSTGGSGAIAIVDAYHFPTALVDFNLFAQNFGLPRETSASAVSTGNRTFQVVYAAGYPAISGGDYIASWNLEAALDIEWAHAMAPNAKIYLVEAASDSTGDLDYAVRVASRLPGVKEVSMSWGGNEVPWEVWNYDPIFTALGVVYLASSGDSSDQMEYPAASPNVISCGGTSVNRNVSGAFVSETGWNTAGCGPSAYEPRPGCQIRIASLVGARRGVSDVAFDADPSTGVYVYDSTPLWGESGWWILGGTSVSSPALAGVLNLAASYGNGFALNTAQEQGRLYANLGNANAFRDVTSGTDGQFSCRVGWDFVTGVGSPKGLVGK
jgi:kumamolisin